MRRILLVIVLICMCTGLRSQNPEKYRWFSAGLGGYGSRNSAGFGLGASYDLKEVHHFKIRLITVGEFALMSDKEPDTFIDAGVLYSHIFGKEWFRITASGGPGLLSGRKTRRIYNTISYDYLEEKIFTPAILLELGLDLVSRRAGIGMAGFANINPDNSIRGIIFRISFGRIR